LNEHEKTSEIEKMPCEMCLKEIPKSEAKTAEGSDYVLHFCGLDCYEKWQQENESKK